jgi:Holliday junction resolvase
MKPRKVSAKGARNKGSNYEREVASYLSEKLSLDVKRALLSGGGRHTGAADLEGLPGISAELKRVEKLNVYDAMKQANEAAVRTGDTPVVITRRNGVETGDSLVVMKLSDWVKLYKGDEHGTERVS